MRITVFCCRLENETIMNVFHSRKLHIYIYCTGCRPSSQAKNAPSILVIFGIDEPTPRLVGTEVKMLIRVGRESHCWLVQQNCWSSIQVWNWLAHTSFLPCCPIQFAIWVCPRVSVHLDRSPRPKNDFFFSFFPLYTKKEGVVSPQKKRCNRSTLTLSGGW